MMEINKEFVKRAIYGDRKALFCAFSWISTDQGYTYWYDQFYGRTPIDVDALRKMLADSEDKPKTWGEMTDAEKGAVLLADHEKRTIQMWLNAVGWIDSIEFGAVDDIAYRVKPEPKRETVNGWWNGSNFHNSPNYHDRTHIITFDLLGGEPDCDSIRMERI